MSLTLPLGQFTHLVRFGSKSDLSPDYQTISNMSAIRSLQTDAIYTFENVILGANKLSLGYPSTLLCTAATKKLVA
jgi:hypothetical protein